MVAPTPTSALLHSSTMVKAGVYIALRFAPGFAGTFLSQCLTACGAFTFLAASAMAVSQSNGKKILAYSTIGNLGLIFACAGINTPEAITAAILLIIFHAFSKALLFLSVGDIEQHTGSLDIEVMRGALRQDAPDSAHHRARDRHHDAPPIWRPPDQVDSHRGSIQTPLRDRLAGRGERPHGRVLVQVGRDPVECPIRTARFA